MLLVTRINLLITKLVKITMYYMHNTCMSPLLAIQHKLIGLNYTGCAKKKKDILNIHIKSEEINIFSQKFC